ncbi:MAG: helix-turn-helix domain-containing protein [Pseudomonadota bacterium]
MRMAIESGPDCPISRALQVIGDHWTLLIIRDLFLHGPCKFSDLERSVTGVNVSTLSKRLKTLEKAGLVERRIYSDRPPRADYRLTRAGQDLKPVMLALTDWARIHAPEAIAQHYPRKRA